LEETEMSLSRQFAGDSSNKREQKTVRKQQRIKVWPKETPEDTLATTNDTENSQD